MYLLPKVFVSLRIVLAYSKYGTHLNAQLFKVLLKESHFWGFLGGAVVDNLPANAGDTGSSPGLGRSHMPRSN